MTNLYLIHHQIPIINYYWMASINTNPFDYFPLICFICRQLSCVSPSGQLQAIVRKVPGKKGKDDIKQFLEVHVGLYFQ